MDFLDYLPPGLAEWVDWIRAHDVLLWWVAAGSAVLVVGTPFVLPFIVARIPEDYFATKERLPLSETSEHPALRWVLRIARNLFGAILLLLGLVMLVTPGPGLIAVLAGVLLMDFPGKRRLEMWVIRRPGLLMAINWFRMRRGRPPLMVWSPQPKGLPAPVPPSREKEATRK